MLAIRRCESGIGVLECSKVDTSFTTNNDEGPIFILARTTDSGLLRELLSVATCCRCTRDEDLCMCRVLSSWMFGNLEYAGLDKVMNRGSLARREEMCQRI